MKFQRIRKLYLYSAIFLLLAALIITGLLVAKGLSEKSKLESKDAPNIAAQQSTDSDLPIDNNYNLIIDKIAVAAPVIINVDGNNKASYDKALEDGVAHLKGSASPGRNGNSFLFGHSSYFPDKPGNYKEVFINLNDLIPGDIFEIQTESGRYVYRITDKKVVEPNDVSVAAQNMSLKQMTLMTCWPIGTIEQRLVVVGELVE